MTHMTKDGTVYIQPDDQFQRMRGYTPRVDSWGFSESWTLEFIDDASTHIPEDWS